MKNITFGFNEKNLTRTYKQEDLDKALAEFKVAQDLVDSFDLKKDYREKTNEVMEALQDAVLAKKVITRKIEAIEKDLEKNKKVAA